MKKKITHIVLMISFLVSAICCSVDAQKISFPVDRPESSNLDIVPLEEIEETPEILQLYTVEEMQQVNQNLIGIYRGTFNNELMIINIRLNNRLYTINSLNVIVEHDYDVVFLPQSGPTLRIYAMSENQYDSYRIRFSLLSRTDVVGFYSVLIGPPSSFNRLENNEIDSHHDEL